MNATTDNLSILRPSEVCRLLGVSRGTLHNKVHAGDFPKPIQLGERSVGWRRADVETWLEQRPRGFLPAVAVGGAR
jgi:prophage regulatory protein